MFDPKVLKQAKQNAVTQKESPAKLAMMPSNAPPQHKIRERAYELYENRGRAAGQDEQDWFRAEKEILEHYRSKAQSRRPRSEEKRKGDLMTCSILQKLWNDDGGQDIAEYAVMLAVILVIVVGTVRLVGSNSNTAFSSVASSLQ